MNHRHPKWAEARLLQFVNFARSGEDILNHPNLQDNPDTGEGSYAIGEKVAQAIVDYRPKLTYRRYREIKELLDVPGLGTDKLDDLLFSFTNRADAAFEQALRNDLLGENWELNPQTIDYRSADEFLRIVNNRENYLRTIAPFYSNSFHWYSREAKRELEMRIHRAHLEAYFDNHLGAFQFAFWWYLFDYDNWFSYDRMKIACETYLGHHPGQEGLQFRMIHLGGYSSITEHRRGMTIPTIVNYPELRITIWDAQLND